jgi:peptide chain release factor subunit 1
VDVINKLRLEVNQCGNIKSKSTRTNVQRSLNIIIAKLSNFKVAPDNGLIIFCGEILYRQDKTNFEYYSLSPPNPVSSFNYRCNNKFEIFDAESLISTHKIYGLIVLDLHESCWGTLSGSSIKVLGDMDSIVPSKHSQGGQSAQRFERLRDISIKEYFIKLGERVSSSFIELDIEGIIIGGCGMTKDDFIKGKYLHYKLQKKIVGSFNTAYTNSYGLKELVNISQDKLNNLNLIHEREVFNEFLVNLSKDTGKSVYGINNIREKLVGGAIKTLIVSSKYYSNNQLSHEVEIITSDSDSGKMLDDAFGGIVAILRYK